MASFETKDKGLGQDRRSCVDLRGLLADARTIGDKARYEELLRAGAAHYPKERDQWGHPFFVKELLRLLLDGKRWAEAEALAASLGPQEGLWAGVLTARARRAAGDLAGEQEAWRRVARADASHPEFRGFIERWAADDPGAAFDWLQVVAAEARIPSALKVAVACMAIEAGVRDAFQFLLDALLNDGVKTVSVTPSPVDPSAAAVASIVEALKIDRVLLTTMAFNCWAGSQIVARDIAHLFRRAGVAEVTLFSNAIGGDIADMTAAWGVRLVDMRQSDWWRHLPATPDLVWGQHWPMLGAALRLAGVAPRLLVASTLSHYEPVEALLVAATSADCLVANSVENASAQARILTDTTLSQLRVFPNSLDASWFSAPPSPPTVLQKVLIVSNHPPPEVVDMAEYLSRTGVEVDIIGMGHAIREVDADIVDAADAVVSIGHSVQKAMARCRPVFVYDRFGGPGWLTPEGVAESEEYNHSGRSSGGRRSADLLVAELRAGFGAAAKHAAELAGIAAARYRLEDNLASLLRSLPRTDGQSDLTHRWIQPSSRALEEKILVAAYWGSRNVKVGDPVQYASLQHHHAKRFFRAKKQDASIRQFNIFIQGRACGDNIPFTLNIDAIEILGAFILPKYKSSLKICIRRNDGLSWTTISKFDNLLSQSRSTHFRAENSVIVVSTKIAATCETEYFDIIALQDDDDSEKCLARILVVSEPDFELIQT